MKRILPLILSLILAATWSASGQGMRYQTIARDASGQVLANTSVTLELSLVSEETFNTQYYLEVHNLTSDDKGLISVVLGLGESKQGTISAVPWTERPIYLKAKITSDDHPPFKVEHVSQLWSAPYAFHADKAMKINEKLAELRNQSINWTTSGNVDSRPPVHFWGTRDAQDLVIKTDSVTRAVYTAEGQYQIYGGAAVAGVDTDPNSYPVYIEGSDQGIVVTVNGSRSSANNFFTFADDEAIWGRIEGQTLDELFACPEYIIQSTLFGIQAAEIITSGVGVGITIAGLVAAGTGAAASLIFAFAAPGFYAAAVGAGIEAAVVIVEGAALLTESIAWANCLQSNIGVAFLSGGADYAEWLKRHPESRDLDPGEVVGIKGGIVSLNTADADHLMVVSTNPAYIGNMQKPEEEALYEKVAFLGQAPVKVIGPVAIGDYILPSGNFDGSGVAVHPADMKLEDFDKIIGVSWEEAADFAINYVNIGIGLNENDLAPKVDEISDKIDNIIAYLEGTGPLHPEAGPSLAQKAIAAQQANNLKPKLFSNEEFDQMVDQRADHLLQLYGKAEQELRANGFDFNTVPGLEAFLSDPINELKKLRRDPEFSAPWGNLDHFIKENNTKGE